MDLTFVSEKLPDEEAFDAYSQAVMRVAERLRIESAQLHGGRALPAVVTRGNVRALGGVPQ